MKLIEKDVTEALAQYLESRGLDVIGKFSTFTHADDKYERSFETDLAIGPKGTAGNRSEEAVAADSLLFAEHATVLGDVMNDLV